jgi:hypothetical protein
MSCGGAIIVLLLVCTSAERPIQIQIVNDADSPVAIYEPEEPDLAEELIGTLELKGQSVSILTYVDTEYAAAVTAGKKRYSFVVKDKPVKRYLVQDGGVTEEKTKTKRDQPREL